MDKTAEQVYTNFLRQLASPKNIQPGALADTFRDVERMHAIGQLTDWQLQNAREAYSRTVEREPRAKVLHEVGSTDSDTSAAGSKIGDAANWAMDQAKSKLHSVTERVRERASTAVVTYTRQDPVRVILIAAGVGAVLMGLVAMMARSGVRTLKRKVHR